MGLKKKKLNKTYATNFFLALIRGVYIELEKCYTNVVKYITFFFGFHPDVSRV